MRLSAVMLSAADPHPMAGMNLEEKEESAAP